MTATDPRPALAAALAARPAPLDRSRPGGLLHFSVGTRKFAGRMMTPEFRAWDERQRRRIQASIARCLERARSPEHDNS